MSHSRDIQNELRETLSERAKLETQLLIIKNLHREMIERLVKTYETTEDEVLSVIYLSKFVMGDVSVQTGVQHYLSDDERTDLVMQSLVESKKYIPNLELKTRIALLELTWKVGYEVDRFFRNALLDDRYPLSIIYCTIIDQHLIPLLTSYLEMLSEEVDVTEVDFRWVLAEVLSSMTKGVSFKLVDRILTALDQKQYEPSELFYVGWVVCEEYIKYSCEQSEMMAELVEDASGLDDSPDNLARLVEKRRGKTVYDVQGLSNRYLNDDLTFGALLVYKLSTGTLLEELEDLVITSKGSLRIKNLDLSLLPMFMELSDPMTSVGPLTFHNCNFQVSVKTTDEQKQQRHLYIHHVTNPAHDVGVWSFFLLQTEDINLKQLETILQHRIPLLPSVAKFKKVSSSKVRSILTSWVQKVIVDLHDEHSYVGQYEDVQKTQKYVLNAVVLTTPPEKEGSTLVFESIIDEERIDQATEENYPDELRALFKTSDGVVKGSVDVLHTTLTAYGKTLSSLSVTPTEILFVGKEDPFQTVFLYSIDVRRSFNDPVEYYTAVSSNKNIGDIAHRGKTFQSRRNIQRTTRVIAESRKTNQSLKEKLEERTEEVFVHNLLEEKTSSLFPDLYRINETDFSSWNKPEVSLEEDSYGTEGSELVNTLLYYVTKDHLMPYWTLVTRRVLLMTVRGIYESFEVQKKLQSNHRQITEVVEKVHSLPTLLATVLSTHIKLEIDDLETTQTWTENCLRDVLEVVKDMPSNELREILISM